MKKRTIVFFIALTTLSFLTATLLTILIYNIVPEKGKLIWLISPGVGALFGLLVFPTFKKLAEKE